MLHKIVNTKYLYTLLDWILFLKKHLLSTYIKILRLILLKKKISLYLLLNLRVKVEFTFENYIYRIKSYLNQAATDVSIAMLADAIAMYIRN